jgi:hypothetical protein
MNNVEVIISKSKYLSKLYAVGIITRAEEYDRWDIGHYWIFLNDVWVWDMEKDSEDELHSVERCEKCAKKMVMAVYGLKK